MPDVIASVIASHGSWSIRYLSNGMYDAKDGDIITPRFYSLAAICEYLTERG